MPIPSFFSLLHISARLHPHISADDIAISPTASGFSFPSAKIAYLAHAFRAPTTGSPFSKPSGRRPPGEVSPRHIILAPPRTNLMAPLSTWTLFIISGASSQIAKEQQTLKKHTHHREKRTVTHRIENWLIIHNYNFNVILATKVTVIQKETNHFATTTFSFLGNSSSAYFSNSGYCSIIAFRMPRPADAFTWLFEMMNSSG